MAQGIKLRLAWLFFKLAARFAGIHDERAQAVAAIDLDKLADDQDRECEHRSSLKAGAMGHPFRRKCLDCKEDFDRRFDDGN